MLADTINGILKRDRLTAMQFCRSSVHQSEIGTPKVHQSNKKMDDGHKGCGISRLPLILLAFQFNSIGILIISLSTQYSLKQLVGVRKLLIIFILLGCTIRILSSRENSRCISHQTLFLFEVDIACSSDRVIDLLPLIYPQFDRMECIVYISSFVIVSRSGRRSFHD